ncbi:hypothetical protein MJM99_31280, partial [Salmonella enterica subsp. enterica serovar Kentucky]|nr:hypothetical protein [Salmonella enterica subsp. enterica serovar Kentucky]
IRSISDEKFSSPPPSLPMPKISSGCGTPCGLQGVPHSRQQAAIRWRYYRHRLTVLSRTLFSLPWLSMNR